MPSIRGALFLNPCSGARQAAADVEAAAREAGLEVFRVPPPQARPWPQPSGNVANVIREHMAQGRRLFVAAGGDGTINSVIQPIVNSDASLAVIPLGTYNHFARDLGLPLDWREALDTALTGSVRQVDAARVNDRFFVNNLSIGLYPELVVKREERGRDYPRWKANLYAAYATLRKYPHVALTIETEYHREVIRTHIFMVSNNSYDLSRIGIEAPRNTLEAGRLSVYWLPHIPRAALMRFLARYLAGRVTEAPGFRSFRTTRLKVQSSKRQLRLGIDGEVFSMPTPLMITIVPKSLLVKVPR